MICMPFLQVILFDFNFLEMNCKDPEVVPLYDRATKTSATTWEEWDKKVRAPKSLWLEFKKEIFPKTVRMKFQDAAQGLAKLLLEDSDNNELRYMALLIFLKEHPVINRHLLIYASVAVAFRANLTSHTIISPFEVTSKQ